MKTNKNGVKLLAVVMALAMVFTGVVAISSSESNASENFPAAAGDLVDLTAGTPSLPTGATYSAGVLTLENYTGNGFYSTSALTIKLVGNNTITMQRPADATGFSAIYTTGALTIQGDEDESTSEKLTISITGSAVSEDAGLSAATYGIVAASTTITGVAIDFNIAESDSRAFAIYSQNTSKIENVTGQIVGGNRAIQMQSGTMTIKDSTLTLIGGEKAVNAQNPATKIDIQNSSVKMLVINTAYNNGNNDVFGFKGINLELDNKSTLETDGIHMKSGTGLVNAGKITINAYQGYAGVVPVNTGLYIDYSAVVNNSGQITISEEAQMTIVSNAGNFTNTGKIVNNGKIVSYKDNVSFGTVEGTVPAATVKGTVLTLNNYNGSDVFTGSYTEVILVGENTITLKDKSSAIGLGSNGKIYSVEGTGSLSIVMDVTKATGAVTAISGTAITIDGVTIDIEITAGANPEYGSITGISASGNISAFTADIGITACVTDYKKEVVGIKTTVDANDADGISLKNTVVDVSAGMIGISAQNLDVANSAISASASENAINITKKITATIDSEIDVESFGYDVTKTNYAIVAETLDSASDSEITASSMSIKDGTNNATVINEGNMVITGTYTNKGAFVNDGTINVLGSLVNAAGTFANNGDLCTSPVKNKTSDFVSITSASASNTSNAYFSSVAITGAEILADGSALVEMTLTVDKTGSSQFTIPGVKGKAILDGGNLLSLTATYKQMNGSTTLAQGSISITKTTDPADSSKKLWQITSSGTVKFEADAQAVSATNVSKTTPSAPITEVAVADATSGGSMSVTGGEFVNDGKLSVKYKSDNFVAGGKLTNNADMAVSANIGITNGTLSGDFTASKNVAITLGVKGVIDSVVTYNGTYTPIATTEVPNPVPVAFENIIDLSAEGKHASETTITATYDSNNAGYFTLAGLDKLADNSDITVSAGKALINQQTIPKKVVMTILSGATLDLTAQNTVSGVIAAQDGSTINMMVEGEPSTYTYGTLVYIISFQKDGYTYYCNLAYALANVEEGMTLTVNDEAIISENVTVKKDVTLNIAAGKKVTINGEKTLTMGEGASFVLAKGASVVLGTADPDKEAIITGTIVYGDNTVVFDSAKVLGIVTTQDATTTLPVAVKLIKLTDSTPETFVIKDGSVAVTAGNVDGTLKIGADGTKIGSFVVNKGAASYVVYNDIAKATTKVDGTMNITAATTFYGKVQGDGSVVIKDGVTVTFQDKAVADILIGNGTSGFDLSGVSAVDITKESPASDKFTLKAVAKTTTKDAYIALGGTVFAGDIEVVVNGAFDALTVSKKATVVVPADVTLTVNTKSYAVGLVKVAGTINMKVADDSTTAVYGELDYQITYTDGDYTVYTYLATGVSSASAGDSFSIDKTLEIDQDMTVPSGVTITIAEDAVLKIMTGKYVTIGTAVTTIGATTVIDGKIILDGTAFVVVYNDGTVDLSETKIVTGTGTDEKTAKNSQFTVLNQVYATVYVGLTTTNSSVNDVLQPKIDGYRFVQWMDVNGNKMNTTTATAEADNGVGNIDFDAKMNASQVQVVFQKVDGITYYVNNVKQNTVGAPVYIAYGSTVTAVADYGYSGTPLVNGKAYITVDSTTTTIVGSGVSPTEPEPTPEPEKDDGMGITDYLLIVLVVLAAILVVIVAIRMMRS